VLDVSLVSETKVFETHPDIEKADALEEAGCAFVSIM
jgi:hypothetical protein